MNSPLSGREAPYAEAEPAKKLSDVLREIDRNLGQRISLRDLIGALGDRSFVPLMILFALPNVFSFVPGASVISGLPLIFIAVQLVLRRPSVWLPSMLSERSVDHGVFTRLVACTLPWIEWVERLARPRYWPFSPASGDRIIGATSLVMAVFLFLPIPFANFLPAVSVVMLALGLGERDGLWIAAGMATSVVSAALVFAIFSVGAFAILNVL